MKLNNYKVARAIMVLTIIICIPLGNYLSVSKQTKYVIQEYIYGEGSGMSAFHDILDRYNDAINLRSLARRYDVDSTTLSDTALELFRLLDTPLESHDDARLINVICSQNSYLTIEFDELYRELKEVIAASSMDSKETDLRLATGLYDDFHSSANIISRSNYNKVAFEYNQMLQSFPNNALSFIHKASPMPIFGE